MSAENEPTHPTRKLHRASIAPMKTVTRRQAATIYTGLAFTAEYTWMDERKRESIVAYLRRRMAELGIDAADVAASIAADQERMRAARYRDAAGNTWDGKGRAPQWVVNAISAGSRSSTLQSLGQRNPNRATLALWTGDRTRLQELDWLQSNRSYLARKSGHSAVYSLPACSSMKSVLVVLVTIAVNYTHAVGNTNTGCYSMRKRATRNAHDFTSKRRETQVGGVDDATRNVEFS